MGVNGCSLQRTITHPYTDINDPELPYRTLSHNANILEYTEETSTGVIPKRTISHAGEKIDYKLVTFTIDDPENPKVYIYAHHRYKHMSFLASLI